MRSNRAERTSFWELTVPFSVCARVSDEGKSVCFRRKVTQQKEEIKGEKARASLFTYMLRFGATDLKLCIIQKHNLQAARQH